MKLLLVFFLFFSSVFAENRSNHSYTSLGFTRFPTATVSANIDGMIAKSIQGSGYDSYIIEKVWVLGSNNNNDISVNNKFPKDLYGIFAIDSSLNITISGLNDFGFKYGAVVELNANTTRNSFDNSLNAKKTFLYGEFSGGKFEFGATQGASQKLKIDAGSLVGNKSGINGRYLNFVNLPSSRDTALGTAVATPLFILIPQHPTGHDGFGKGFNNLLYKCDLDGDGVIDTNANTIENDCYINNATSITKDNYALNLEGIENSLKISFYPAEFNNIQFGISFTPDTGNRGVGFWSSTGNDTDLKNVLEAGINYTNSFNSIGIAIGATGEFGKSERTINNKPFREDLFSYQYGGIITYSGLSLAYSQGNWGKSGQYNGGEYVGEYITKGASFEFGPILFAATVLDSKFQKNTYSAMSVNLEYKASRNFIPYIEYTQFEFDIKNSNIAIKTNSGTVIIVGFQLSF
jgi:hypothetical protein